MSLKQKFKHIEQSLGLNAIILLRWIISRMPFWLYRIFLGLFMAMGKPILLSKKKLAIKNLHQAFGDEKSEEEIEKIAHDCFMNFGQGMVDLIYIIDKPHLIKQNVRIEGGEYLDEAIKAGNGVIFIGAHYGNFILMYSSMVELGYKTNVIMRRTRDEAFEKYISDFRTKRGIQTIYDLPQRRCVGESLKALRRNEVLFILLDQNYGTDGRVFVKFFGLEAATATGPVVFGKRTGAVILPIFMMKDDKIYPNESAENKHFKQKIVIKAPIRLEEAETEQKSIQLNISRMTAVIEAQIRLNPYQWGGWMHNRWKARTIEEQTIIDALNEKKLESSRRRALFHTNNKK